MIFKSRDPTPSEWLRGAASPLGITGGQMGMVLWHGRLGWALSTSLDVLIQDHIVFFLMTCNKHIPGHT